MQYIILIGDETFSLDTIRSVRHENSTAQYDVPQIRDRYAVDFGTDYIFYDFYGRDMEGYDPAELPVTRPNFITMRYTSEERVKRILRQRDFPQSVYVDNDHGVLLPLEAFIARGMPLK